MSANRDQQKRAFAVELSKLVMVTLARDIDPDIILEALEEKVRDEKTIQASRRTAARSY